MTNFESLVHCEASHGEGEITGPRSTVSRYTLTGCATERGSHAKCRSEGALEGEIRTHAIDAELVYIDQAKHEVAMLLDPDGGTYIGFECGGEPAEGRGPFLAPGSPVNNEASVFTVTLSQSGSMQTPDEYEGAGGEKLKASPMGEHGGGALVPTGVEATFTVHTSVPVDVRAISTEEVQAKQREEAAAKKHQEEESVATAAKKHDEEEAAAAAAKKLAEEVVAREEETLAALRSAVSSVLVSGGARAKIGALLKHGGLTESFTAPEPGALLMQWWRVPPGAHLAKRSRRNPALVAQGSAVFSVAGARKIKVSLTGAGRRLLASANHLELTASVRFTPTAHPPISATGIVRLKR